jgi:putative membrane-bound dehydrogenase-like protein
MRWVWLAIMLLWAAAPAVETSASDPAALGPSPEDVLASFQHHAAVAVEIAAAEPAVRDPVAMCFDEAGRLFVAEMGDYPTGPADDPQAVSRIVRLSDADGDGRYESRAVFADNLSFITGLTPWRGGLVVTLAGEICWLADTDGDDVVDTRERWFQGFTEDNTQLRANHPTLAPDGTFYVANGLRGGDVVAANPRWQAASASEPVSIRGRDFRFDAWGAALAPDAAAYEAVSGNGQFGLSFDDFGTRFICSNRNPCVQIMLEEHDLRRNPAAAVEAAVHDVSPAGELSRIYPISSGWTTSNLHAGQFSAACGVTIYRGDGLSDAFRGNAFTCDPTGNLVHRQVLRRDGLTYACLPNESQREFLASSHDWFRPVALADGPDGCLYVIDMARAVIEHPQFMPDELKSRPDLLHGRNRGRLWRIKAADSGHPQQPHPVLTTATPDQLVRLLAHPNGWHRDTAARLLLEQPDKLPTDQLGTLVASGPTPEARSRALWLLAAAHRVRPASADVDPAAAEAFLAGLHDSSPLVRRVAVRVSPSQNTGVETERESLLALADDPDAAVRGELALRLAAIRHVPQTGNVTEALARIVTHNPTDIWTLRCVATASAGRAAAILTAVFPRLLPSSQAATACIEQFAELAAAEDTESLLADVATPLARTLSQRNSEDRAAAEASVQAFALVRGLGQGLARRRTQIEAARSQWPVPMRDAISSILDQAASVAEDTSVAEDQRLQGISCLAYAPSTQAVATLSRLLSPTTPQQIRLAAILVARRHADTALDLAMLADLGSQTPAVHRAVVESLVARPASAVQLLTRLEASDTPPVQLTDAQWAALEKCSDDAPQRVALLKHAAAPEDRQEVVRRYQASLALSGDFERGLEIFRSQCSSCHRVAEVGADVGPDISDSRTKQPAQYLSDILDPNRAIDANFFGYTLLATDGRLLTGIITAETGTSVTLRQPDGRNETLLRDEIDQLRSTGQSLMPVGLERTITPQQMADLINFLKNWRYETATLPSHVLAP